MEEGYYRKGYYTRPLPTGVRELQAQLKAYLDHYNRRRPHRALGGLAPLEFLARMQEGSVPQGVSNVVANYRSMRRGAGMGYNGRALSW